MKTGIISGVIFILLILLIIFGSMFTSSQAKAIDAQLEELSQAVSKSDWEKSGELYDRTYKVWKKSEPKLALLFHHKELDDIDEAIQKLGSYISLSDREESLTEITVASFNVAHLREKDKIGLENLF